VQGLLRQQATDAEKESEPPHHLRSDAPPESQGDSRIMPEGIAVSLDF
jgi:hypothetical protein